MVFMTSNIGAREMTALSAPKLGFAAGQQQAAELSGKIGRTAIEAARRRFAPEFMNRIDKVVVFHALGDAELRRILDLELEQIQERWSETAASGPFAFSLSDAAKDYLLEEGVDLRYGARHLKRAVERSLVHPMSNLVASGQVREGDQIVVDYDDEARRLLFYRTAESAGFAPAPDAHVTPGFAEPPAAAAAALTRGA